MKQEVVMGSELVFDLAFDLVWYAIVLFGTYSFIWGKGVDRAYDINSRIGKFCIKGLEDKEKYKAFARVLAVIVFVFCTALMLIRLRGYLSV